MTKMKPKFKKAYYAVIQYETQCLENDAYFNGGDCFCSGTPEAVAIYESKKIAESASKWYTGYKIIKVKIIPIK